MYMNKINYGFIFNDIKIDKNIVKKHYKNELGKFKINNEITFYQYIINQTNN